MAELKPCKCGKIQKIKCETNSHSPTYKVYWAACEDCDMYACANTEQELVNSWNSYIEMELKPNYNECPWCKNKNIQIYVDYDEFDGQAYYQMVCQKCRASGPRKTTEQQAIDAWNKRSDK